jgi:hypothetical protein
VPLSIYEDYITDHDEIHGLLVRIAMDLSKTGRGWGRERWKEGVW